MSAGSIARGLVLVAALTAIAIFVTRGALRSAARRELTGAIIAGDEAAVRRIIRRYPGILRKPRDRDMMEPRPWMRRIKLWRYRGCGDRPPLALAVAHNAPVGLIQCLLEDGCNPNCTSWWGWQASHGPLLSQAIISGRQDVAVLLIRHGATIDNRDHVGFSWSDKFGDLPVFAAMSRRQYDVLRALVAAKVEMDGTCACWKDREKPIHAAARLGDCVSLRILLDGGADPMIKDPSGMTALDIALQAGHADAVKLFKERSKQ